MNIDDLTIGQARHLVDLFSGMKAQEQNEPWEIGENYLIRTVTMTDTGRLVAITPNELVLEDAAWIADTGRFADALETGNFDEIEPFPDGRVIIGRSAIIDAVKIQSLPRIQK